MGRMQWNMKHHTQSDKAHFNHLVNWNTEDILYGGTTQRENIPGYPKIFSPTTLVRTCPKNGWMRFPVSPFQVDTWHCKERLRAFDLKATAASYLRQDQANCAPPAVDHNLRWLTKGEPTKEEQNCIESQAGIVVVGEFQQLPVQLETCLFSPAP